jgi:hypothetical protein
MGKLQPSRPFSGVGPMLVMPRGCISLPVTFGTAEIFCMESVLFDVVEVSLPFNAILGRLALYQFMVVAHYEYLVLKMPSPNGVLRIWAPGSGSDSRSCWRAWGPEPVPPSSCQHISVSAPRVEPSGEEDVPAKIVQVRAEAGQTTANRNPRSSPSSRLMSTCLPGNRRKCPGSLGR